MLYVFIYLNDTSKYNLQSKCNIASQAQWQMAWYHFHVFMNKFELGTFAM